MLPTVLFLLACQLAFGSTTAFERFHDDGRPYVQPCQTEPTWTTLEFLKHRERQASPNSAPQTTLRGSLLTAGGSHYLQLGYLKWSDAYSDSYEVHRKNLPRYEFRCPSRNEIGVSRAIHGGSARNTSVSLFLANFVEDYETVLCCASYGEVITAMKWYKQGSNAEVKAAVTREANAVFGCVVMTVGYLDDDTLWRCVASNNIGSSETLFRLVVKYKARNIRLSTYAIDVTEYRGYNQFSPSICSAKGKPPPRVTWIWSKGPANGTVYSKTYNNSTAALHFFNLSRFDDKNYTCVARNYLNTDDDKINYRHWMRFYVAYGPENARASITNSTAKVGDSVKFTCRYDFRESLLDAGLIVTSWYKDGKLTWLKFYPRTKRLTRYDWIVTPITEEDAGVYECKLNVFRENVISNNVTLTVIK